MYAGILLIAVLSLHAHSATNAAHTTQLATENAVPTAPVGELTVSATTSSRKITPAPVMGTSSRSPTASANCS